MTGVFPNPANTRAAKMQIMFPGSFRAERHSSALPSHTQMSMGNVHHRTPHPGLEVMNCRGYLVTLLGYLQRWEAHFLHSWFIPLLDLAEL